MSKIMNVRMAAVALIAMLSLGACGQRAPSEPSAANGEPSAVNGELSALNEEPSAHAGPIEAGDRAPAWTGRNILSGATEAFPQLLRRKPAVMVFWATWCPYCKAFMPYTESILADYADHDVQIVTFNVKERGKGDPRAYIEGLGFSTVSIADADPIAALYGVEFIPGLMVVDGDGVVVYRRGWTDLPAGQKVAKQWDLEVRGALDAALKL